MSGVADGGKERTLCEWGTVFQMNFLFLIRQTRSQTPLARPVASQVPQNTHSNGASNELPLGHATIVFITLYQFRPCPSKPAC
jgi:hypothetical protein